MAPPPARVIVVWTGLDSAQVLVDGGCDGELPERLGLVLERVLAARATHMVVDLHRLVGDDTAVVELLAASWHRLRARCGGLAVHGLRDRLASRPEVSAFPEVFGAMPARTAPATALRTGTDGTVTT